MEFRLSEVERLVRQSTAELVRDVIAPAAAETDRTCVVPEAARQALGELGYFGASVPADMGGAEMGAIALVLALEEVARGCSSTALLLVGSNCLVVEALLRAGTPDQQKALLPRLASGAILGAGCLAEPDAGVNPLSFQTTVAAVGSGLRITGRKSPAPAVAIADVFVITAAREDSGGGRVPAVVIIERTTPGLHVGPPLTLLGQRACAAAVLSFDQAEAPPSALLRGNADAADLIHHLAATFNLGLAAVAIGVAKAAFDSARHYAHERRQFGHPICDFEAIRTMIAQSGAEIEAARHLMLCAAAEQEAGRPFTLLAGEARLMASQTANRVANRAVQIHGGYGYTKDYAVERHYRDARLLELWPPASEDVCETVAAELLAAGPPGL